MKDNFKDQRRSNPDRAQGAPRLRAAEWERLEEIGDLHFHESAYSTALDYYRQLIDENVLSLMERDQAVRLLRKSVDSNILLGNLDQVDLLLDRAEELIARTSAVSDPDVVAVSRAIFQTRRSTALRERGRLHDALNLAKRAFSVLALTDEHTDVAILQVGMGICYLRLGRLEKAEEFFNDGLSTFRRIGHDLGVANLLNNLALLQKIRCRWDRAISLMDKAVELARGIGASHLLPGFYLNQGIILQKIDRLGESRSLLDKGLRLAASLGDRMRQTRLYLAKGRLEILSGRLARAEELVLEGKALADQNRFLRESIIADEYLGDILLARGEYEKARFNYQLGLEKSRAIAAGNDLEGELQRRMGEAHLAAGRLERAVAVSQAALAVCEKCGENYEIGFCHATLGKAYAGQSDLTQADHHFRQAIATFSDQRLTHHWCRTILQFTDHRLDSAGEAELLLLRRYLMDAQENGASAVSDRMLCDILERLAEVQIRLNQFDDALLTVFELERHAVGLDDLALAPAVVELRDRIEEGLLGGVKNTESHLQAISCLPGLFAKGDASIPRNLESVLCAGMERVQADSLFSELDEGDPLLQTVPALASVASSCVFLPIALHGRQFGLLFLGKSPRELAAPGFDRASLDFLATYMGFLALFLYEKGRDGSQTTQNGMFEKIESFENIITQNVKMLEMLGLARKVAPSDLTVLLNGETGTGKGLLAYSIHALSKRADHKFLTINCAAIPESLLESELFGHKRGSFTGAHSDKRGLLAEAEGGTVFLDEIGKMPLSMQGKLLHFLDTKVVRPVGSNNEIQIDVRIICASKSNLLQGSRDGRFLEDLYYRLLDFPLVIPPLRKRADDIVLLANHFIERFSQEMADPQPALDQVFLDLLIHHSWPGNVRELEKALRRAIVLAHGDSVLRSEHLPEEISGGMVQGADGDQVPPLRETLAAIECREIGRALKLTGGNKSAAARGLKISYPNLLKKIRHYGLG